MIKLSLAEFCQFNLIQRFQLVEKDGTLVAQRTLSKGEIAYLYRSYNHMVEVVVDWNHMLIIKVEPMMHLSGMEFYQGDSKQAMELNLL